ncbi:MAG: NUDIX domain-containing protein [Chlamydiia bacterium]|nr:NUDIX domain-containing protein [Chlamydiia bacterium]
MTPPQAPTQTRRQFTATVYVIEQSRALLIFHKKMQKWLPPGGHIDPNELPSDAAVREALEETGIEIELITDENIHIDRWNAVSFPRPWMCMLEHIPATEKEDAHQHMDMIYVGRPIGGSLRENQTETSGLRWFSLAEIETLQHDVDIFVETVEVLRRLLKN